MTRKTLYFTLSLSLISLTFVVPVYAANNNIHRANISPIGEEANGRSYLSETNKSGRYFTYISEASNLVPNDTNNFPDIFLYDRVNNTNELISVSSSGEQSNDTNSVATPAISATGRFVAFASGATNLVTQPVTALPAIYIRDRDLGTTELVSVDSTGNQLSGNYNVVMSENGRYVAFESAGQSTIMLRDRKKQTTQQIDINNAGQPANAPSSLPVISGDGRYVLFQSTATNLDNNATTGKLNVFQRDLQTNTTTLISKNNSNTEGNAGSYFASISPDGEFIAYLSDATNLASDNNAGGILLFNRTTQQTTHVGFDSNNIPTAHGDTRPEISGDNNFIAFDTASSLVSTDTNNTNDIYRFNRINNTTELISKNKEAQASNGYSGLYVGINYDGSTITFSSDANDLVNGDTNNTTDIFYYKKAI